MNILYEKSGKPLSEKGYGEKTLNSFVSKIKPLIWKQFC